MVDREALEKCTPGCESLEEVEPDKYKAVLSIGVAAIKGRYNGIVRVAEKSPPSHLKLLVEGAGGPGFIKAEGDIDLSEQGGKTILQYSGEVQVGGLMAGAAQRVLGPVAKMLIEQFFKKLDSEYLRRREAQE